MKEGKQLSHNKSNVLGVERKNKKRQQFVV